MLAYFKYTNGGVFTLSGNDYKGMINIRDGQAYTGDVYNSQSKLLSGSNTFAYDTFIAQENLGRTINDSVDISNISLQPNTILDNTTISSILSTLDNNNRELYKSQFFAPINDLDLTSSSTRFYGVSSSPADIREPDDIPAPKSVYSQIDPFEFTGNLAFMDEAISSNISIPLSSNTFRYYINTATDSHILSGSLTSNTQLVEILGDETFEPGSYIISDTKRNVVYQINGNTIISYNKEVFDEFGKFIRVDEIEVDIPDGYSTSSSFQTKVTDKLFVFYVVSDEDPDDERLILFNKSSGKKYFEIELSELCSSSCSLEAFSIRVQDDALLIYLSITERAADLILIDTELLTNGLDEAIVFNEYISKNTPEYHYENIDTSTTIDFSIRDSNVFYIITAGGIQLRYINNPEFPARILDVRDDLLFLDDYLFNTTEERFNKIQIKFNSNKLKSNYPNLLTSASRQIDDRLIIFLHFIGRLYTLDISSTSITENERTLLNLTKNFDSESICNKTYAGLSLNMIFRSILDDCINIYNNYSKLSDRSTDSDVYDLYRVKEQINELNNRDFSIHGNERISATTLLRVITSINDIQKTLADDINSIVIS